MGAQMNEERPHFRPWRELAVFAITGMELSWFALWYRIFTQSGLFISFWRAFAVLGGVGWTVYLLARLLYVFRIRASVQRSLVGGTLLMSVLVGLKLLYFVDQPFNLKELLIHPVRAFLDRRFSIAAEAMVAVIVLVVAWRAISLVYERVGPAAARNSFLAGILALCVYGLIAPLTGEMPVVPLYLFLFFSLLAMSLARVNVIEHLSRGSRVTFDRKWLIGILGSALGLLGFAILVAILMQRGLIRGLVLVATWLWQIVFFTGMILMIPVLLVLMAVAPSLSGILQASLREALDVLTRFIQEIQTLAMRLEAAFEWALERLNLRLRWDIPYLRPVLLGLLLGGLLTAILWSLRVFRGGAFPASQAGNETLSPPGGARLLKRANFSLPGILKSASGARRTLAAARIRRIYGALLSLSEDLGQARPAGCTPLEFLPDLKILFAGHDLELEMITQAYLRVRYAEAPESRPEIQEIETAWRRIQAAGGRRIREKVRKSG